MKKIYLLFSLLFYVFPSLSQSPLLKWVGTYSASATSETIGINHTIVDHDGNCIVTGEFRGTCDFDVDTSQFMLTALSTSDYFVAKYSAEGALMWVNNYPTQTLNGFRLEYITCDNANNIIVAGRVTDTLDVDLSAATYNLFPEDTTNAFIMKFSGTGNFMWAKSTQQPINDFTIAEVKFTSSDELIVTGSFRYATDFDFGPGMAPDTSMGSGNNYDMYILKLDINGNYIWSKTVKNTGILAVGSMAIDTDQNIFCVGSFTYNTDFDPGPGVFYSTTNGYSDGFTLILDSAGNFVRMWKLVDCANYDGAQQIVMDNQGFLYIYGSWSATIDFDKGPNSYLLTATGSSDNFLTKMDKYGNGLWAKKVGTYISGTEVVLANSLKFDDVNGILLGGFFSVDFDFDPDPTSVYNVLHVFDDGYILNLDANGQFKEVLIYSAPYYDMINDLDVTPQGTIFISGHFRNTMDFDPGPGQYPIASSVAGMTNGFLSCLDHQANFASGRVYRDMNLNGIYDSGDFPISNSMVKVNNNSLFTTLGDGTYIAQFDSGSVTLSYNNIPALATVVPSSYSIANSSYGNTNTNKDFAIQIPIGTPDGTVVITNLNPTRAGRTSYQVITYSNPGTTPISGTIKLVVDTLLTYIPGSILPDASSGDSLWWNFSNLMPQETRNLQLAFLVPVSASTGTALTSNVTLFSSVGDNFQTDNYDTLHLVITGSFDPNDKQVIPANSFTTLQVANGEYLEYIIRFQNTGNDTAFVVQVVDTLSASLDVSTFEVMTASHPYIFLLDENNIVRFIFDNILLPDSNTNEEMSHGFIRYRLKPMNSVTQGNVIENTAHIYFDFNAPVNTNTASTNIILPTSLIETISSSANLLLYPNPAKTTLTIENENLQTLGCRINITDVAGRTIFSKAISSSSTKHNIDISSFSQGIYFVQLQAGDKISRGRFVKE